MLILQADRLPACLNSFVQHSRFGVMVDQPECRVLTGSFV